MNVKRDMQQEIQNVVSAVINDRKDCEGIKNVVWIGAGGSNGGFYPAQYFMEHEARAMYSLSFTSKEFVLACPSFVGKNTLAVICSMRGTKETCEAAGKAKEAGAVTIALYVDESDLTTICDYKIRYESIALDESRTECVNSSIALSVAMHLLARTEGFEGFEDAMEAFDMVDDIYREAVMYTTPMAKKWAEQNKEEKTIYVMASGPAWGSAYIFSICNIEEMLQIDSPAVNCCEFFHGPFEILDETTSVFLLISEGRVRAADERAVNFLKKYGGEKVYMLDARELGIEKIKASVREYFNHVLFSPILNNVYMRQLSYATGKDYMTRRYMWKVEY